MQIREPEKGTRLYLLRAIYSKQHKRSRDFFFAAADKDTLELEPTTLPDKMPEGYEVSDEVREHWGEMTSTESVLWDRFVQDRTYKQSTKADRELLDGFPLHLDLFLQAVRRQNHLVPTQGETWLDALTRCREEMRVELRTVQLQQADHKKRHAKLEALAEKRRLGIEAIRTRHSTPKETPTAAPDGESNQGQEQ
jgi:hypothetical protein